MPSVKRTLAPAIVNKSDAATMTGEGLHSLFQRKLATPNVTIAIQGVKQTVEGFRGSGQPVYLPRTTRTLDQYIPPGFQHLSVMVEYTHEHLDPKTTMTRAEFLMELLGLWECMQSRVPFELKDSVGAEISTVIQYTKSIYDVRELTDFSTLEA